MGLFGRDKHDKGDNSGWEMADRAGAPSSPLDGGWTHSDQPAIASVRGDIFSGPEAPPSPPPVHAPAPALPGWGRVPEPPRGGPPDAPRPTPAAQAGGVDDPDQGLAAIASADPRFDRDEFLSEVQRTFFLVEEAWTSRKSDLSRQVMSDGLWQQHRFQIEGYLSGGKRNVLDDLTVESLTIIVVHVDDKFETITVRILASSSDYDVNDKGKVVRGRRDVEQWSQDWTFRRAAGTQTPEGGGTLTEKCPNCGAPLQLDFNGVCNYCKALVSSGSYDWVLSRISDVPPAY